MLMVASVRSVLPPTHTPSTHAPPTHASPTHASPASLTGYEETPRGSAAIPKLTIKWKAVELDGPPTFNQFTVTSNSDKLKGALGSNTQYNMIWADHLLRDEPRNAPNTVPHLSVLIQEFATRRHISPIQRLIITNIIEPSTKAVINKLEADYYVPGNEFYKRIQETKLWKTASYLGDIKDVYVQGTTMFFFYIEHPRPPPCPPAGPSGSGSGTHTSAHAHPSPLPSGTAGADTPEAGCCKGCIVT